jgi:hypothetical protein
MYYFIPYKAKIIFFFLFIILNSANSLADIRNNIFPERKKPNISLYLGGRYQSDYNSKYYIVRFGAKYKNPKSMHEFKFYNKVNEAHTTTKDMRKTEEKYDIELSNKMKIADSQYYINLYNFFEQDKYDNFTSSEKLVYESDDSGFYSRTTSLIGLGKIFSKNFEADFNIGWVHSKGEGSSMAINPVLYLKKKINKKLLITTRISRIKQQKIQNDYFSLSVIQKFNRNWALSLNNKYKRSQYIYRKKNSRIDIREVRKRSERSLTLNLKYSF